MAGCRAAVDVAEMDNYPYSCWRLGPARIRPICEALAADREFPGNRIGDVFPRLSPLSGRSRRAEHPLHRAH